MKELYTERHHLRSDVISTSIISRDKYQIIVDFCERYYGNLAFDFPEYCPDFNNVVCGVDLNKFFQYVHVRIPDLFYYEGYAGIQIVPFADPSENQQYALLDFIEYIARYIKTIKQNSFHDFFQHYHLSFIDDHNAFNEFRQGINEVFQMAGLSYKMTENKQIERITEMDTVVEEALDVVDAVEEPGLRALVAESVSFYKSPLPANHKIATEKIWDALERIKTIFMKDGVDKKKSSEKLMDLISAGNNDFRDLFNTEYKTLTDIGNKFRIRHHETDKIDINDDRYYDYFYNRCLSLIVMSLRFIGTGTI